MLNFTKLMTKRFRYLAFTLIFFIIYCAFLYSGFGFFSFDGYKPRTEFWDLSLATNLMNCYHDVGFEVFVRNSFVSAGCGNFFYGYSTLIYYAIISSFGSIKFWGFLTIFIFVYFTISIHMSVKVDKYRLVILLALFSPGVFLLFASGNLDLFIALTLLLSTKFLVSGKEKTALFLILITTLFKFYTAPVLLIAVFIVKNKFSKLFGILLVGIAVILILLQMIITPLAPFPDGAQNKFGMAIFDNYARKIGIELSDLQGEILGLTFLFLSIILLVSLLKNSIAPNNNLSSKFQSKHDLLVVHYLIMAGTSISCYIFALNVDYRLIYIALAGITLMQLPHLKIRFASFIFPFTWLLSLWIVFPFATFAKYFRLDLQPLGDFFMIGTMAYLVVQGFYIFKYRMLQNKNH